MPCIPEIPDGASLREAALIYAQAGLYVGPCRLGKHPGSILGKGWQDKTSTDPAVINSWFDDGFAANGTRPESIFIHCGRSGLIAFDVDEPAKMRETAPLLCDAIKYTRPPILVTRADGSRFTVLFALNGTMFGNSAGSLGEGFDVRGENGIIVVPPSPHLKADAGGAYRWHRVDEAPVIPGDVADYLSRPAPASAGESAPGLGQPIPDGARNETLWRYACSLRGRGVSMAEAQALLVLRMADCVTPVDHPRAEAVDFITRAWQYEPNGTPAEVDEAALSFEEQLEAAVIDTHGLDHIADPEPLIGRDVMFRNSLVWLVGKPGSFKSFVALDIAGCVGTGVDWQGYRVSQGPVLFLIAEGVQGTKKRVRAWEQAMGRAMEGVSFLPVAVQSKVEGQWAALVAMARRRRPALIVIDTQARVTVGAEENSNTEMGRFVDQAEHLRKACGATVMIVHHIGRNGETGRGATTLDGAMSTIVKISKEDDVVTLECQKSKDGPEWLPIMLRTVPVGDSVVLAVNDLTAADQDPLAGRRWLADWWRVHGDEPVSVSVLVRSGVTTEATFHRNKRSLIHSGILTREGASNATRYRLSNDPTFG